MAICCERMSRQLFTALILYSVFVVLVPLPFGIWGGMWNSIVLAPDHCLFVYLLQSTPSSGPSPAFETWSGPGCHKRSSSVEVTRRGEHEREVSPSLS